MTGAEQTKLIVIKPENDTEVMAFYNQALELEGYSIARVIGLEADLKSAIDDLSIIARLKKAMTGKRKDYLQPFQEHIKEVNESYQKLMAPIENADKITREKILAYQLSQKLIREKQENINALRLDAAKKEMELKGELTESVNLIEVIPEAPKHISTDMGTTSTAKIRKWEVEDLSKVPLDYLMIDSAKVGKVVRAGISSIPGIHIWLEDSLRITAK